MHLILSGATGTVGYNVLLCCLASPSVERVTVLSRSDFVLPQGAAKAQIIVHTDYNAYPPALLEQLKGCDGCIWAQGTSQTKVSKEFVLSLPAPATADFYK